MHISSTRGPGVQVANHLLLAIVTAALAACGGGGGSSASADNPATGSSMSSTSMTTAGASNAALPTGSAVTVQATTQPALVRVNADTAGQQTLAEVGALQGGG